MIKKRFSTSFLVVLALSACSSLSPTPATPLPGQLSPAASVAGSPVCATPELADQDQAEKDARAALEAYFDRLASGDFAGAVGLYGGDYSHLREFNPSIDPEDLAALLKNACEINGYQCLRVRQVVQGKMISPGQFEFVVEFTNRDGSLFVRGPCCGADETQQPPEAQFPFSVKTCADGRSQVQDLPVYVP